MPKKRALKIFVVLTVLIVSSCSSLRTDREKPLVILWAWESPQDLRFVDPMDIGVAYLSQTIVVTPENLTRRPRKQPLIVPNNIYLEAVTRIETDPRKQGFTDREIAEVVRLVVETAGRPDVAGVQIDFDARESERVGYRKLLQEIRKELSKGKSLSVTALVSFCQTTKWLKSLPVDDAIPMVFEMGRDQKRILAKLRKGIDFKQLKCRNSYGRALYEEYPAKYFRSDRTNYFFKKGSWKEKDMEVINENTAPHKD